MSAMVNDPATEDIASRVTGGEIVPLASRATWLATGSSGADTVTTLGLQFDTVDVVSAGLVGGGWRGERGGRLGPCWPGHGHPWWSSPEWSAGSCSAGRWRRPDQHRSKRYCSATQPARWPAPLVVAREPAPAPATHNAPIPQEGSSTRNSRSLRARDSPATVTPPTRMSWWTAGAQRPGGAESPSS